MTGPGYRRFVETHGETRARATRELVRDLERFRRDLERGRRVYDISGELSKRDTRELVSQIEVELETRSQHERVIAGVADELATFEPRETAAEELGRLRRELTELDHETPEHAMILDRVAVLVRELAVERRSARVSARVTS